MTVNTLNYLGLTLLSIVIQFTVMELAHDNFQFGEKNKTLDLKGTSRKIKLDDVLNVNKKPHALYYRSVQNEKNTLQTNTYSNTSLPKTHLETSTDISTTIIDELYDENSSITSTTDVVEITTEMDNVTEISFFDNKNQTSKPNIPKKITHMDCSCNLLYKACDINCCCDIDCSEAEKKIFASCDGAMYSNNIDEHFCYASSDLWQYRNKIVGNLFCIVKQNLPAKRNIQSVEYDASVIDKSFKWHEDAKNKLINEFIKEPYKYGDHVWVLKNGSIRYIDLPSPILNSYCNGRKPLIFLKDEKIICTVKLKDLEIFQILNASEDATLVSVVPERLNSSVLNCSTLYCTNWTFVVCDASMCVNYNKSVHDPVCTESYCTNLALKLDYIFYFYDGKIVNVTIKLYVQKVSIAVPYMVQEINVRFVLTNGSEVIEFSGSPGYINGLPVIISLSKENYTDNFFNGTSKMYIPYLNSKNGICIKKNITDHYVTFKSNKRLKCRFQHPENMRLLNESNVCKNINDNIIKIFGVNQKTMVSPYGNPQDLKDEEWLSLQTDIPTESIYGEYNDDHTKLHCSNMITRKSLTFTYAATSDNQQKILNAKIEFSVKNITFVTDDISTVLIIDTMFIDQTKPSLYEYAGGPHLNIHLPKDFFFPFPQNRAIKYYASYVTYYCMVIYFINK